MSELKSGPECKHEPGPPQRNWVLPPPLDLLTICFWASVRRARDRCVMPHDERRALDRHARVSIRLMHIGRSSQSALRMRRDP